MKTYIQETFRYMSQPDHFTAAVIFILIYTVFAMVAGIALAWVAFLLFFDGKEVDKRPRPSSFDEFIDQPYGGYSKIRKVK